MTEVRRLAESEFRAAHDLFRRALLVQPSKDEEWTATSGRYEPGRVLGAFVDGELAGTAMAMTNEVAIPGKRLPAAAVTAVGVRADRTRRGVLRALMRAQLDDVRERGEPVAMLHASEGAIYERFGYGVATRCRTVQLDRSRAGLRADAPSGGRVRVMSQEDAASIVPGVYRRCAPDRPGRIDRSDAWWSSVRSYFGENCLVAVHSGADGAEDGFALYEPKTEQDRNVLQVYELEAVDAAATAGLWRFLLGVDLVDRVVGHERPLDEPLEWWLTDRRQCRVTGVSDDLWLRLVDVFAALQARSFGAAEPVVLDVRDEFLPDNSGSYRIGPDGVSRSDASPQLSVDVSVLAALYLGDELPSTLAAAGRIEVHDATVLPAADRLFGTLETPYCGTGF